jgi:hypothetical protein
MVVSEVALGALGLCGLDGVAVVGFRSGGEPDALLEWASLAIEDDKCAALFARVVTTGVGDGSAVVVEVVVDGELAS